MKEQSSEKIHKTRTYLSSLGQVHSRPLFGGYTLALKGTVFAMVTDGELYLRACEQSIDYFQSGKNSALSFPKRGCIVHLNYYKVDDMLWQEPDRFLALSSQALDGALRDKEARAAVQRLKDLPNLNADIEGMLVKIGVGDIEALQNMGAKDVWKRLREINKRTAINLLFALEGAITGRHAAVLPLQTRQELQEWVKEQIVKEERSAGSQQS